MEIVILDSSFFPSTHQAASSFLSSHNSTKPSYILPSLSNIANSLSDCLLRLPQAQKVNTPIFSTDAPADSTIQRTTARTPHSTQLP
jgi:hypothetical protein